MKKRPLTLLAVLICTVFCFGGAHAGMTTFSGYFNNAGNSALVGSDLGPALFGDDWEIANNVALYALNIPFAGSVSFDSNGFAAGGADPYFTLFQGNGNSATFLESNYVQAFSTGGDFNYSYNLAAGDYMIAMGVFANMSFAENNPDADPNLGDGFIGLGVPGYLGNYYYELDVSTPDGPTQAPEPSTIMLLVAGLAGIAGFRKRLL